MKYLPIHFSSSIWLRDNLWTNLNQFCVNIMELIVYYAYMTVWYVSISLNLLVFSSFSPTSVAFLGHISCKSCCTWRATANHGGYWRIWGSFIASIGRKFYWTLPRQFILHLHLYNILRFLWGTLNKE